MTSSPVQIAFHAQAQPRGFIYVFFSLLVIYPLSIGPVAKMYSGKNVGPQCIEEIYKPIAVLAGRSELAGRFFDWYLHPFGG